VIICTQNRASSLQVTLEHLVAADHDGIRAEVIIVDYAGHDTDKKPTRRSRFNGLMNLPRNFARFTPRAEVSVASVKVQPGHRHSLRSGFK
jgi:hypothetical protein